MDTIEDHPVGAEKNGPKTQRLITRVLDSRTHPEQGYRSSLGIMRLGKAYSPERLEAACERALFIKAYSYKSVQSILKNEGVKSLIDLPLTALRPRTVSNRAHPILV